MRNSFGRGSSKKNKWLVLLLVLGILVPSISYFYQSQKVEAAVADIEILTNIETNNDSQTTNQQRWQANVPRDLSFTIQGNGLTEISPLLTGPKIAVLVIPLDLVGSVKVTADALIKTHLTVDLRNISLLNSLFSTLDTLVTTLLDIVAGALGTLTGVNLHLDEVFHQINLLNNLQDLPNTTFSEPLKFSHNQQILSVELDNGLGRILASSLKIILTDLSQAISSIHASGSGLISNSVAALINLTLAPLKSTLVGVINGLFPLLELGGSLVSALADASILGNTTVKIDSQVEPLQDLQQDLDAQFYGTVVKSTALDVDLLKNTSSVSSVFYQGEKFGILTDQLPQNLDFGSHPIQTAEDQTFTIDRPLGNLVVEDSRSLLKDWQFKVHLSEEWQTNQNQLLDNAQLTLYGGELSSTFSEGEIDQFGEAGLTLYPRQQQTVFSLKNTTSAGEISLPLTQAELFVPKNTKKSPERYETTLVWTLSESPNE